MNGNCLLERPDLNGSDMSLTAPTFPSLMDINQLLAVILPAPLTDGVCDKCLHRRHCTRCKGCCKL